MPRSLKAEGTPSLEAVRPSSEEVVIEVEVADAKATLPDVPANLALVPVEYEHKDGRGWRMWLPHGTNVTSPSDTSGALAARRPALSPHAPTAFATAPTRASRSSVFVSNLMLRAQLGWRLMSLSSRLSFGPVAPHLDDTSSVACQLDQAFARARQVGTEAQMADLVLRMNEDMRGWDADETTDLSRRWSGTCLEAVERRMRRVAEHVELAESVVRRSEACRALQSKRSLLEGRLREGRRGVRGARAEAKAAARDARTARRAVARESERLGRLGCGAQDEEETVPGDEDGCGAAQSSSLARSVRQGDRWVESALKAQEAVSRAKDEARAEMNEALPQWASSSAFVASREWIEKLATLDQEAEAAAAMLSRALAYRSQAQAALTSEVDLLAAEARALLASRRVAVTTRLWERALRQVKASWRAEASAKKQLRRLRAQLRRRIDD